MIFSSLFAHLIFSDCPTFIDLDLQEIYKVIFTKSLPKYCLETINNKTLKSLDFQEQKSQSGRCLPCKHGALGCRFAVTALGSWSHATPCSASASQLSCPSKSHIRERPCPKNKN